MWRGQEANTPKRRWGFAACGSIALAGSLFCGAETALHLNHAWTEIRELRALPPSPDFSPQQSTTPPSEPSLQQLANEEKRTQHRIILANEDTDYHDYAIGGVILFCMGGVSFAIRNALQDIATANAQPPPQ